MVDIGDPPSHAYRGPQPDHSRGGGQIRHNPNVSTLAVVSFIAAVHYRRWLIQTDLVHLADVRTSDVDWPLATDRRPGQQGDALGMA
jgi:hypothetical protein